MTGLYMVILYSVCFSYLQSMLETSSISDLAALSRSCCLNSTDELFAGQRNDNWLYTCGMSNICCNVPTSKNG